MLKATPHPSINWNAYYFSAATIPPIILLIINASFALWIIYSSVGGGNTNDSLSSLTTPTINDSYASAPNVLLAIATLSLALYPTIAVVYNWIIWQGSFSALSFSSISLYIWCCNFILLPLSRLREQGSDDNNGNNNNDTTTSNTTATHSSTDNSSTLAHVFLCLIPLLAAFLTCITLIALPSMRLPPLSGPYKTVGTLSDTWTRVLQAEFRHTPNGATHPIGNGVSLGVIRRIPIQIYYPSSLTEPSWFSRSMLWTTGGSNAHSQLYAILSEFSSKLLELPSWMGIVPLSHLFHSRGRYVYESPLYMSTSLASSSFSSITEGDTLCTSESQENTTLMKKKTPTTTTGIATTTSTTNSYASTKKKQQQIRQPSLVLNTTAPAAVPTKTYPVILCSHGLFGWKAYNSAVCAELASQGYIVVAVDHIGDSICSCECEAAEQNEEQDTVAEEERSKMNKETKKKATKKNHLKTEDETKRCHPSGNGTTAFTHYKRANASLFSLFTDGLAFIATPLREQRRIYAHNARIRHTDILHVARRLMAIAALEPTTLSSSSSSSSSSSVVAATDKTATISLLPTEAEYGKPSLASSRILELLAGNLNIQQENKGFGIFGHSYGGATGILAVSSHGVFGSTPPSSFSTPTSNNKAQHERSTSTSEKSHSSLITSFPSSFYDTTEPNDITYEMLLGIEGSASTKKVSRSSSASSSSSSSLLTEGPRHDKHHFYPINRIPPNLWIPCSESKNKTKASITTKEPFFSAAVALDPFLWAVPEAATLGHGHNPFDGIQSFFQNTDECDAVVEKMLSSSSSSSSVLLPADSNQEVDDLNRRSKSASRSRSNNGSKPPALETAISSSSSSSTSSASIIQTSAQLVATQSKGAYSLILQSDAEGWEYGKFQVPYAAAVVERMNIQAQYAASVAESSSDGCTSGAGSMQNKSSSSSSPSSFVKVLSGTGHLNYTDLPLLANPSLLRKSKKIGSAHPIEAMSDISKLTADFFKQHIPV